MATDDTRKKSRASKKTDPGLADENVFMTLSISKEWLSKVDEMADEMDVTRPQFIRQAIMEKWYREHGPEAK